MKKPIIICVDDEKYILDGLRTCLINEFGDNFVIEIAENGQEALEMMKSLLLDGYEVPLVIVDYVMPGMKGDELLKKIQFISQKTLKIMLTGQASLDAVTNALNEGDLYKYVAKPWDNRLLTDIVKKAINKYEELHANEIKYEYLLQTLNSGVIVHKPDTSILLCNNYSCKLLGLTKEQMMGKEAIDPSWMFYNEDKTPMSLEEYPVNRVIKSQKPIYGQVVGIYHPTKNDFVWVLVNGLPVFINGILNQVIICFVEITEIKNSKEKFCQAKQEAEDANNAKSKFIANMSHEIRTPINAIMGFSQIIKDEIIGTLNPTQSEYMDNVIQSSNRLLRLVDDILDISRIESEKINFINKVISINELLERIVKLFMPQTLNKDLKINYYIKPNVPKYLKGDEYRIEQVLKNLISNACKFTEKGTIEIFLSMKSIDELLVEVKDTGIGISEEEINKLFEKFYQVDSSYSKKFQGAGLGLSISKELIELMGGKIWVKSKLKNGSSFYFTIKTEFPDNEIEVDDQKKLPIEKNNQKQQKLKILLAEDDQLNRKAIMHFLTHEGHNVKYATNGHEVLSLLKNDIFDLILLDIKMPLMDGIEVTKKIRSTSHGKNDRNIPIIAFTAYAMKSDIDKFIKAGMNDYITKPFDKNKFKIIISQIISSQKSIIDENSSDELFIANEKFVDDQKNLVSESNADEKKADESKNDNSKADESKKEQKISLKQLNNDKTCIKEIQQFIEESKSDFEFLSDIISAFLNEAKDRMELLKKSVIDHDTTLIAKVSHKLTAAFSAIYVKSTALLSQELQEAARLDDVEKCRKLFSNLQYEMNIIIDYIMKQFPDI